MSQSPVYNKVSTDPTDGTAYFTSARVLRCGLKIYPTGNF